MREKIIISIIFQHIRSLQMPDEESRLFQTSFILADYCGWALTIPSKKSNREYVVTGFVVHASNKSEIDSISTKSQFPNLFELGSIYMNIVFVW